MNRCPKCDGTAGLRFEMRETHIMFMAWGGVAESGDSGVDVTQTMPACLDCGHRFRWSTIQTDGPIP